MGLNGSQLARDWLLSGLCRGNRAEPSSAETSSDQPPWRAEIPSTFLGVIAPLIRSKSRLLKFERRTIFKNYPHLLWREAIRFARLNFHSDFQFDAV